jgi:hypothetical protein
MPRVRRQLVVPLVLGYLIFVQIMLSSQAYVFLPLLRADQPTASQGQLGKYFATVDLGTPAQSYNLLVATASPDLLVAGAECTPRCDYSPAYEPTNSSSGEPLCLNDTCTFQASFPDHGASVLGTSWTDVLQITAIPPLVVPFGVWTSIHNLHMMIPSPMSGLMGLLPALGPVQSSLVETNVSLLTMLYDHDIISELSLSLCLGDYAGLAILGGSIPQLHAGTDLQSAPIDLHTLGLTFLGMSINGKPLDVPPDIGATFSPVLVDSTFNELVVPTALYNLIASGMLSFCSVSMPGLCEDGFFGDNHRCYFLDPPELALYPTIQLSLVGLSPAAPVVLNLAPSQWLIFVNKKGYCAAITPTTLTGMRIGTQILSAFYTFFNFSDTTPSVSFAPSVNCTAAIYQLTMIGGNQQEGPVSTAAKQPLSVRVTRLADGLPAVGVYVNFQVTQGSAALTTILPTNQDGLASATLIYGYTAGAIVVQTNLDGGIPAPLLFFARSYRPVAYLVLSSIFTAMLILLMGGIFHLTKQHRKQHLTKLQKSPLYALLAEQQK